MGMGGGGGGGGTIFGLCMAGLMNGGSFITGGGGGTAMSSDGCIEGVGPASDTLLRGGGTAIGGREEVDERRASSAVRAYTSA